MQLERARAVEYVLDVGQLLEVVVHSFDGDHCLVFAEHQQSIVLDGLGIDLDARVALEQHEFLLVSRHVLSLCRCHLDLRVEVGEELCHHVLKSIEHREDADHGGSGYSHSAH